MSAKRQGHLRFDSEEALAAWYARSLAEGSVEVPLLPGAEEGADVRFELELADGRRFGAHLRVLQLCGLDTPPRMRALVLADADLREVLERFALSKRAGRLEGSAGGRRQHARYDTCLQVRFPSFQHLSAAYASNVGAGGMFIRTAEAPPVGTRALLAVTLPDGQLHEVEVEVVRHVEPSEAAARGVAPGIGVKFTGAEEAFTRTIERLVAEHRDRPPYVLLVDDNVFFLEVVGDVLREAGFKVAVATDAFRAMRVLMDKLYELDAVVLDLHMPGLHGQELLERLNRVRRVVRLRLVVLSSAAPEVLARMVGPDAAELAISKTTPTEQIVSMLRELLGRPA
jgi:uncharacterized protein (TIGR02266 family)